MGNVVQRCPSTLVINVSITMCVPDDLQDALLDDVDDDLHDVNDYLMY